MQQVAQAWLVLQLTHSAFLVGVVAAARNLPTLLLFGLFGGAVVDRFKKKKTILFLTKICAMLLAIVLSLLTFADVITLTQIAILAFLLGVVDAIDNPARQVFVAGMVEKQDLSSAIAINSGVFNAARFIGPSIAGFLIFLIEPAGVFMVNAIGYFAVIIALVFIKEKEIILKVEANQ
jgi:MFS family permease